MTKAIPVEVADAIAEELRAHTFTLKPETIHRGYIQDRDLFLSAASDLRLDVVVSDCTTEPASQEDTIYHCTTDIAVRKRFAAAERNADDGKIDEAEIDRLILLVQEIHDYFSRSSVAMSGRVLSQYNEAIYEGVEFRPIYDGPTLRENQQFTGIVSVTFKVYE